MNIGLEKSHAKEKIRMKKEKSHTREKRKMKKEKS